MCNMDSNKLCNAVSVAIKNGVVGVGWLQSLYERA